MERLIHSFLITFLFLSNLSFSQDEKQLKNEILHSTLSQNLKPPNNDILDRPVVQTPYYELDLADTAFNESIVYEKKGVNDWIHLFNSEKKKVFSLNLAPQGWDSKVYKISIRDLSPTLRLIAIHYFEGNTIFINEYRISRLYFLTIENNNLDKLNVIKGPVIWEDSIIPKKLKRSRLYELSFEDINNDGTKEVLLKSNNITHIFHYLENGKWLEL